MLSDHKLLKQFVQFMLGGGLYFISGFAIFAVCYSLIGWPWWLAKIIGDVIGLSLGYLVQRYIAFKNPTFEHKEAANRWRYVIFASFSVALDYGIVGGLKQAGLTPYLGMLASSIFFTGWNYLGYRFWVFRVPRRIL